MAWSTDTILLGIGILILYAVDSMPNAVSEAGGVGAIGAAVVLIGYFGTLYSRLSGSLSKQDTTGADG